MQKLKKIDKQTNVLTWFEIPVSDINRAKTFYETILDIEMILRKDGNDEAIFFPFNPDVVQATSGRITGVLTKTDRNTPSDCGTVVYINASPSIQLVLDKVNQSGGKIVLPRTQMPAGFIAIIIDTEGNKVGLHAEQ
jgi:predicted enzyme related to lactoylglutathione lyase